MRARTSSGQRTGPAQKEGDISRDIMARAALMPDLRLWRNSIGTFRAHGFHVRAGLPKGSADLIGVLTVNAYSWRAESGAVGVHRLGLLVAIEVKKPGEKPDAHQAEWLADVRTFGGFAAVVTSVDTFEQAIARARAGALE